MGVSGCGKTSVARALAQRTGGRFVDADYYHSLENKGKMAAGIPLTDEDRAEWLGSLNNELKAAELGEQPFFLACSALKEAYRAKLREGINHLEFIYLRGDKNIIHERLLNRKDHFMSASLLNSQFAILEEPNEAFIVDITKPIEKIIESIMQVYLTFKSII